MAPDPVLKMLLVFSQDSSSGLRVCLETGVGGVTEGVQTHQVFCVALELFFRKNEASFVGESCGVPGKSFALMAQEELGGFGELAAFQAAAIFLNVAELIEGFLELAGEARAVKAELGQHRDHGLGVGVLGEQLLRGMGCG